MRPRKRRPIIRQIRNERVYLDRDLALMFKAPLSSLLRTVEKNRNRFPQDFLFRLNAREVKELKPRPGILPGELPYAFTAAGVMMFSGLFGGRRAAQFSVSFMRSFAAMRRSLSEEKGLKGLPDDDVLPFAALFKSPLPDFAKMTDDQVGEFWDTHDSFYYWDQLEKVRLVFKRKKTPITRSKTAPR